MSGQAAYVAYQEFKNQPAVDYADIWKYSKISLLTFLLLMVLTIGLLIFSITLAAYTAQDKYGTIFPNLSEPAVIGILVGLFLLVIILGVITAVYRFWWIPQKVQKIELNRGRQAVQRSIEAAAADQNNVEMTAIRPRSR